MLPWLIILLNSFLPVDLVALILPSDLTVAEGVPQDTIVGQFVQVGDLDSEFEIIAAMPGGILDINSQTSEVSVTDPTRLDDESLRRIVLLVRQTKSKPPDLYRSLFVDKLLRDGAEPHHLKRFTTDTRYHLCVVEVTDIDEPPHPVTADLSDVTDDNTTDVNANDVGRVTLADSNKVGTPDFLIVARDTSDFQIDRGGQIQAYLDRLSITDPDHRSGVHVTNSGGLTANDSVTNSAKTPSGVAAADVEAPAVRVPVEVVESLEMDPMDLIETMSEAPASAPSHSQSNGTTPVIESPFDASHQSLAEQTRDHVPVEISHASSDIPKSRHSALWWLSLGLSAIFFGGCCLVVVGNRHRRKKYNLWGRLFFGTNPQPMSQQGDIDIAASLEHLEQLDDDDFKLLESRDNGSTSADAARLMQNCLSAMDGFRDFCSSTESSLIADQVSSESACSASLGHENSSAAEVTEQEPATELAQALCEATDNEQGQSLQEMLSQIEAGIMASASTLNTESATSSGSGHAPVEPSQVPGATDHSPSVKQREGDTTTSNTPDQVEIIQSLIRDEFGIDVEASRDDRAELPCSGQGSASAQRSAASVKKESPLPIDLGSFRQISRTASQQAIQTSKLNLRQRKIRRFLMLAAFGCSVVCGLMAMSLSRNVPMQLLLVSVAALALLGYMKSCRSQDESD